MHILIFVVQTMKGKLIGMLGNFAFIKLFFALFTSFLLYEEFFTFLIEKPTHTSSSKVKVGPKDYPDITICPFPSWNPEELRKLGYGNSFDYSKGTLESTMIGWSGNSTETVDSVIDKISILKNQTDCPFTRVLMRSKDKEKFLQVEFKLTSMKHPVGRCCQVKYKMLLQKYSKAYLTF